MKMYLKGIFVLAAQVFFLVSCKKNTEVVTPNPSSDSLLVVTEVVNLDTGHAVGSDTSHRSLLFYDSRKRVERTLDYDGKLGVSASSPYNSVIESIITYEGASMLPQKIAQKKWSNINYPNGEYHADTLYIFYRNGIVVKDSMVEEQFKPLRRVRQFVVLSDTTCMLTEKDVHHTGTSENILSSRVVHAKWQNNNLIKVADTLFYSNPNYYGTANSIRTFDDKLNPFRRIAIPYPLDIASYHKASYPSSPNHLFTFSSLFYTPSMNNYSSYFILGSTEGPIFNYDYSADGFPLVCRTIFPGIIISRPKRIYKYRKV